MSDPSSVNPSTPLVPAHDDFEADGQQAGEDLRQARMRNSALSGATVGIVFANEHDIRLAVMAIMSCDAHGGVHHFAIAGEGKTLWASRSAIACINAAELGFNFPGYDTPEQPVVEPGYHDASVAMPRERCPKCGGVEIAPFKYDHDTDCPNN